jgi:neutral ceramidase
MRAGFSRQIISPPLGTRMTGLGQRDIEDGCKSINDELYVRALYCEHEGEAALVMSFDLCFVGRGDSDRFKGALGRALGVLPAQILLSATHTHAGPAVGTWYSSDYVMPDPLYMRFLEAAVLKAGLAARDAAEEAVLSAGMARSTLPMSRRLVIDGKVSPSPRPNPTGAVNDLLPVCLIENLQGRSICLLYSISTHPSVMRGWEISADFCGPACDAIDAHLGAACSMFLQGTAGDSKPSTVVNGNEWNWNTGWEETKRTGEILAEETIACLQNGLKRFEPKIRTALVETLWPLEMVERGYLETVRADPELIEDPYVGRQWAERQLESLDRFGGVPEAASVLMQGVQLGEGLRLVAIEGEPVAAYGHMILDKFPEGVTFPLGYANGEALYLPTTPMIAEGGMEVCSYYQYGFPAPIAAGMEVPATRGLDELKELGVG